MINTLFVVQLLMWSNPSLAVDPGTQPWQPVKLVEEECGIDSKKLIESSAGIRFPFLMIRHGKLCYEHLPNGADKPQEVFSVTKTLAALAVGAASWQTRNLIQKADESASGPLTAMDPVSDWINTAKINSAAKVAHILGQVAQSQDLDDPKQLSFSYDYTGSKQLNLLNDIIRSAIKQDPSLLGEDVDQFVNKHLFGPLGIEDSTWSRGRKNKQMAYTWVTTMRDMGRVGLLMMNKGTWNGERLISYQWLQNMIRPSFEEANTGYGYLTWVNSHSNYQLPMQPKTVNGKLMGSCLPIALNYAFPHGASKANSCNYQDEHLCQQSGDMGIWEAVGLGGHYIVGHPALDMVFVIKNAGAIADFSGPPGKVWQAIRYALLAIEDDFEGNEEAFCTSYSLGLYQSRNEKTGSDQDSIFQ